MEWIPTYTYLQERERGKGFWNQCQKMKMVQSWNSEFPPLSRIMLERHSHYNSGWSYLSNVSWTCHVSGFLFFFLESYLNCQPDPPHYLCWFIKPLKVDKLSEFFCQFWNEIPLKWYQRISAAAILYVECEFSFVSNFPHKFKIVSSKWEFQY